jgi:hypothetical protein
VRFFYADENSQHEYDRLVEAMQTLRLAAVYEVFKGTIVMLNQRDVFGHEAGEQAGKRA